MSQLSPAGVQPVFDRGHLWQYNSGHWINLIDVDIRRKIIFDGLTNGEQPTQSTIDAVEKYVRDLTARIGYFDDAPRRLLVFRDITMDISARGVRLREHNPDDRAQWAFDFPCPIDADLHEWVSPDDVVYIGPPTRDFGRYLRTTFDDDAAKIRLIGEWCGTTLVGSITKFALALLLLGTGENGKSVLIKILRALFERAGIAVIPPSAIDDRFGALPLIYSLINLVDDLAAEELLKGGKLKAAISGGVINTEIKNGPIVTFKPRAGHCFAANNKPKTRDVSHGFFRRFAVVEFTKTFNPAVADKVLAERIVANELPAVAWWAIQHAITVQRRGRIELPTAVQKATARWRTESDPVEQWLTERCEIGLTNKRDFTLASAAYDHFALWVQQRNHQALSDRAFYDRLKVLVDSAHGRRGSLYALRVLPLQEVVNDFRTELSDRGETP